MNEYYVYCYLDPTRPGKFQYDGLNICFLYEPFYIGKGKGNRITERLGNYELNSPRRVKHNPIKNNKIKNILSTGINPYYFKLYENMSEIDSNKTESDIIENIGKIVSKDGPLANMSEGGHGGNNMKYLDPDRKGEIYKRLSDLFKGRPYKGPDRGFKISQYTLDGLFIRQWSSISKASRELGIHKYTIIQNVKGEYLSAGGFIFKKGKSPKVEPKEFITKQIIQLDMVDNTIKQWGSLTEASESLGIRISGISMCCTGKYKFSGGFKWKYKEDYDKERT